MKLELDVVGISCNKIEWINVTKSSTIADITDLLKDSLQQSHIGSFQILLKGKLRKDQELISDIFGESAIDSDKTFRGKIILDEKTKQLWEATMQAQHQKLPMDTKLTQEDISQKIPVSITMPPLQPSKDGELVLVVNDGGATYEILVELTDTVANVKEQLQKHCKVKASFQKLLIKGKFRGNDETIMSCGLSGTKGRAKLMFEEGFHRQLEGEEYLQSARKEFSNIQESYEKLRRMIEHRSGDPVDLHCSLQQITDQLEHVVHGLEGVQIVSGELEESRVEILCSAKTMLGNLSQLKSKLRL